MKAVVWHGYQDVRVDEVPDPRIEEPTDAIVRITSSAICGSDLHLYEVLGPFLEPGDILGHEPMGIVEEVGADVDDLEPGDRVVVPFNISCGRCFMCERAPVRAMRDDAGARAWQGRRALRLHDALRPGPGRTGRVPAGADGSLRADQGAGGAVRRALPLPLGCAADG